MLKRSFSSLVAAAVVAAVPMVHAYPGSTTTPASQLAPRPASQQTVVHFEGCLFTEPALTAMTPLVVPVGVPQPWVLTNVKVIAGDIPDEEAARTIYTLKKAKDDQVRGFYSKRVGVTGRVTPATPRPTLDVVDIREISGACPVLPRLS